MERQYKTQDLWIASALVTLDYKCKVETDGFLKNGNPKYVYVFDESSQLKEDLYKFDTKDLVLDIKTFRGNYLMIKNLIFKENENL